MKHQSYKLNLSPTRGWVGVSYALYEKYKYNIERHLKKKVFFVFFLRGDAIKVNSY